MVSAVSAPMEKKKKPTKTTHLLIGRKAITNLNSILKRKDNTFPTKVCIVKAMVFPVVPCMDVRVGP